ncbi:MAG TPA: alpha/beta hydrolase [Pyrinomonadaceae bacterium]|nr:alpha/beta hydrolase [Pyrinomonadaceae bacterium]
MTENGRARADYAELNGARFYYEIAGEGDALVLVHAGIADRRMWDDQFEALAQHYMVVRYDRRGFGLTEMVAGDFSQYADLYELLKFLKLERATLVGCSQGGKTVLDFTLEHPSMVKALVLVASAVGGFAFSDEQPKELEELQEAESLGDLDRVNELELRIWVDGQERTPEQVDQRVRERVREMNLIALRAPAELGNELQLASPAAFRLEEIRVPTLVVIGDLDTPRTQAAADLLAEKISGAQKVVIKGTAHLPNMEQPEEFNRRVLEFLKRLD